MISYMVTSKCGGGVMCEITEQLPAQTKSQLIEIGVAKFVQFGGWA